MYCGIILIHCSCFNKGKRTLDDFQVPLFLLQVGNTKQAVERVFSFYLSDAGCDCADGIFHFLCFQWFIGLSFVLFYLLCLVGFIFVIRCEASCSYIAFFRSWIVFIMGKLKYWPGQICKLLEGLSEIISSDLQEDSVESSLDFDKEK